MAVHTSHDLRAACPRRRLPMGFVFHMTLGLLNRSKLDATLFDSSLRLRLFDDTVLTSQVINCRMMRGRMCEDLKGEGHGPF